MIPIEVIAALVALYAIGKWIVLDIHEKNCARREEERQRRKYGEYDRF